MLAVSRVAFSLFGFPIYWYGVLIAGGMFLGVCLASAREKRYGFPRDSIVNLVLIAIPIALVCARLYYVAFSWSDYAGHPLAILDVRQGGLAIYGGVLGGALTAYVYARKKHLSFASLADLCGPALALGQAIGRWGNFFNQEAYGAPILSPAWQFFPVGVYIDALSQWRLATFFYESIWCFLICVLLLVLEKKHAFKRPGDLFLWYLALYCAERMVVEGLRADSLYWGTVRVSQLLSAVVLVICLLVWGVRACRGRKETKTPLVLLCSLAVLVAAIPFSLMFFPAVVWVFHSALILTFSAFLYRYVS